MNKLKQRWGITSNTQLFVIILVFAINGSLSAKISSLLMSTLNLTKENLPWLVYYILLFVLVMPLYPFLLLFFGWVFKQWSFFYPFSKKMIYTLKLGFILRYFEKQNSNKN